MDEQNVQLKKKIMRQVYFVYAWRMLFSPNGLRMLILAVFIAEISPFSPYLSLRHIIANMPPLYNLKAVLAFHVSAFIHTQFIVQISLIAVAVVIATYVYRFIERITENLTRAGMAARQSLPR